MIKPGQHKARVLKHMFKSSSKGTWGIVVLFHVDPYTEDDKIWGTIWITDKSFAGARRQLRAIGFDVDDETKKLGDLEDNHVLLFGNETTIEIEESEYQGNVSCKVKWIGVNKPSAKALDALTKGLQAAKSDKGVSKKSKSTPKPVEYEDLNDKLNRQAEDESDFPF